MKVFYSQQGEDVYVFSRFINKPCPDGIFVELGAMDGVLYSNTKFFEDQLQMHGTLIEPTREYEKLIQYRPGCHCYRLAVSRETGPVRFLGEHATAGLVDTMDDHFRRNWHPSPREYLVEGAPFSSILAKSNIAYIDFLSIDVEGGEEVVLSTMDFSIPVYVVCIELDDYNPKKDDRCRDILRQNGFAFQERIAINEFWVNPQYSRKSLLYDETLPKPTFVRSIDEIGRFPFLEKHVRPEVERALRT